MDGSGGEKVSRGEDSCRWGGGGRLGAECRSTKRSLKQSSSLLLSQAARALRCERVENLQMKRKRSEGEEEETMNSNGDLEWTADELVLLKLLFHEYARGELAGISIRDWSGQNWKDIFREYNTRAQMHRFCQRSDQDLLRGGELLETEYYQTPRSEDSYPIMREIFGICPSCALIPVFPRSMIHILQHKEEMKRKGIEEEECGVPDPNLMENLEGGEGGGGGGELNLMNIHEPCTSRIRVSPTSSRNLIIHAAAGGSKNSEESVDAQLVAVACAMLDQKLITVHQLVKFIDKAHDFTNLWKMFLLFDAPLGVKAEALAIKLAQI